MATNDQVYRRRAIERELGFSQAVRAGDFLFISGCCSCNDAAEPLHVGDCEAQLAAIYEEISATLRDNGLDFNNVVKEVIYCRDIGALVQAKAARLKYFRHAAPPAATWVQVSQLVHPDFLLEVEITAYLNR